jgi:hypothetical protein
MFVNAIILDPLGLSQALPTNNKLQLTLANTPAYYTAKYKKNTMSPESMVIVAIH